MDGIIAEISAKEYCHGQKTGSDTLVCEGGGRMSCC